MTAMMNLENYYYGKFYGLFRVFTGYFWRTIKYSGSNERSNCHH